MEKQLQLLASLHYDVDDVTKTIEEFSHVIEEPDLQADTNMSDQFMEKLREKREENILDPK